MSKRCLSDRFLAACKEGGLLASLVARVKQDNTLAFEIRDNFVNIYYRGGNVSEIRELGAGGFLVKVASGYFTQGIQPPLDFPFKLQNEAHVSQLIQALPLLKDAMDRFLTRNPKEEREFQQLVVRENNQSSTSKGTDYLICDMEYTHSDFRDMRFDMIAARWPSSSNARKRVDAMELAIVEMKYGDGALRGDGMDAGGAGILKHWEDLLKSEPHLDYLREEMTLVLRQKAELGLLTKSEMDRADRWPQIAFQSRPDQKTDWILLLANHDPQSEILLRELNGLAKRVQETPNAKFNVKVAFSIFMGYGLYDQGLLSLEEFLLRYASQVYSA